SSMFLGARKLGLGASAAILVASLAARDADCGADLLDPHFRDTLFTRAWAAHSKAQGGGSGVDVAVSVYGGAIQYVIGQPAKYVTLPVGIHVEVFACGTSARTSELRTEIDRLKTTSPAIHGACMSELMSIATDAGRAVHIGDGTAFIETLRRTARGL